MNRKVILPALFLMLLANCGVLHANVGVNIVVANPSEESTQDVAVKYALPPGLQKEDIVETGELRAEYDVAEAVFYVTGEIELGPKETRTVRVVIKDIWKIPENRFQQLDTILEGKILSMSGTADENVLNSVASDIKSRMEEIQQYQQEHAGDVQKRMELFTSNSEKFRRIEEDIFHLERLVRVGELDRRSDETILLTIEARNPSEKESTLPVRYDLPREVTPKNIEEMGGMEIRHDVARDTFYLHAEAVFSPGETKRFQVRIENVWRIQEADVDGHVVEAEELHEKLMEGPEERAADILLESIRNNARLIKESQSSAESVRDRVSTFRTNEQRLRKIKDDIEKLRMLSVPEIAEDTETSKISDVLRSEELFEALRELSDRLLKDRFTSQEVWRILMFIVGFAMMLTAVFYAVWIMRNKKDDSRAYEKLE